MRRMSTSAVRRPAGQAHTLDSGTAYAIQSSGRSIRRQPIVRGPITTIFGRIDQPY